MVESVNLQLQHCLYQGHSRPWHTTADVAVTACQCSEQKLLLKNLQTQQRTAAACCSSVYPCWHLVSSHVQLDFVNAHFLSVKNAGSKGSSSASGLEHLRTGEGTTGQPSAHCVSGLQASPLQQLLC